MAWLRDRLTRTRLAAVAVLLAIAIGAIALGDPLSHPEEGEQATGERGVSGVPRIVFFVGLAIAFLIALPPRGGGRDDGDPGD